MTIAGVNPLLPDAVAAVVLALLLFEMVIFFNDAVANGRW